MRDYNLILTAAAQTTEILARCAEVTTTYRTLAEHVRDGLKDNPCLDEALTVVDKAYNVDPTIRQYAALLGIEVEKSTAKDDGPYALHSVRFDGLTYKMPLKHIARLIKMQIGRLKNTLEAGVDIQDIIDHPDNQRRHQEFVHETGNKFFVKYPQYSAMMTPTAPVQ